MVFGPRATRWARKRKLENKLEKIEVISQVEENEVKLIEPKKSRKNVQDSQKIKKATTILAQIPRYAYLLAIFALLSGVFFPLITPGIPFDHVIQGVAILFLGLVGGILLFKATTSDNRRGILIAIGFALIAICLVLIYHIQEMFSSLYS